MIPASVSYAIHRKHVKKGFTDGVSNDVQWRILSGRSRYLEHLPVLSRAAAIFRECFDPIVATSGRDLIPVMVCGSVVSASLLRIFGREVAELPLVATSRENQGKGYFQTLFSCIESLLYSLNVENLVLPVAEEAESIWTKKLGFRKMSDERVMLFYNLINGSNFFLPCFYLKLIESPVYMENAMGMHSMRHSVFGNAY
ncbi:hypothetical protein CsSME_00009110 [Camellia sinensis var. sinensis]